MRHAEYQRFVLLARAASCGYNIPEGFPVSIPCVEP